MPLVIREIHNAPKPGELNQEWFVVENTGDSVFSTNGMSVSTGKGKSRLKPVGTLDPGFQIAPAARVRVISGNPGKKAHGPAPVEDATTKNYHLFLGQALLAGAGSIVAMSLKQHELARATFDPKAPGGVLSSKNGT